MHHNSEIGDPYAPDVARLLAASEAHAHTLYPAESIHMLDVRELMGPALCFVVARSPAGVAEGCGAVILGEDGAAEIKRMFVAPEARGQGLGSAILLHLEAKARDAGMRVIRLQTGHRQPESLSLYHRFGYCERGPFGTYRPDPQSLFMEKDLDRSSGEARDRT